MEKEKKTVDRRVLRTKKAIRSAFARLLTERSIDEITVSDVALYADINRKTFYYYYAGIHEVIDEIENDIISGAEEILGELDLERDLRNPYGIFEKLTEIINMDMDIFGYLMANTDNNSLVRKIVDMLKAKILESNASDPGIDSESLDIALDYAIYGLILVYYDWMNSDRSRSIEKLSRVVGDMFFEGFHGLRKKENTEQK